MTDLVATFSGLSTPHTGGVGESFSAAPVAGASHRIARDTKGWPALLLATSPTRDRSARICLEHLDVQHAVRCRITSVSGGAEDGTFTVIRCTNADDELTRYFLRAIDPILRSLGPAPSTTAVSRAIVNLVELFRALTQPPAKSVSGLWAELILIRNSGDPASLLEAWRATPEDRYDFSSGTHRIEVKSSAQRERIHHFSLEQLLAPKGCRLIVASLFVERAGAGASLGELIDEIRDLMAARPDLQQRLDQVVASTLGSALRQSIDERFDRELACESIRLLAGESIPTIPIPLPLGILDVHFRADLSQSETVSHETLVNAGGILAALVQH
jgi:hypothetical protein